jgi:Ca-activated chloride channel family protein
MVTPLLVALGVLLITALAERLHARRVARVSRLAFGPRGAPARWALAAPPLRCAAVGAVAWGATVLAQYDPVQNYDKPKRAASKQLLICMDVSPSMMLKDAGPDPEKVTRGAWAGKVVQGILDRLDTETTRVTLFVFYTKALPVVQETFDKEVIRNALDGLPMYVAFEPGPTDMHAGVSKALEHARVWPSRSAMFVVISDGDTSANQAPIRVPDSIADSIVIGVGDPYRSTMINGHSSRQDTDSLKRLAARLGGIYHDGNSKHLPSSVLDSLSVTSPRESDAVGMREAGLIATGAGASLLALLGPALVLFGRSGVFRRARAEVGRRASGRARSFGATARVKEAQA